jgi:sterol desaturase/sphingolipid hydroxylase (fatty acid hydroxylase superfamily)
MNARQVPRPARAILKAAEVQRLDASDSTETTAMNGLTHEERRETRLEGMLERWVRTHWIVPCLIFIPAAAAMLVYALAYRDLDGPGVIALTLLGAFAWTLDEYLIHRFLFHYPAARPAVKRLVYIAHLGHHADPKDRAFVTATPLISVPVSAVSAATLWAIAGAWAAPVLAGFWLAYLYYEYVHYSVHNRRRYLGWTNEQRKRHFRHHFKHPHLEFGVTIPLWDYVFGTAPDRPAGK